MFRKDSDNLFQYYCSRKKLLTVIYRYLVANEEWKTSWYVSTDISKESYTISEEICFPNNCKNRC